MPRFQQTRHIEGQGFGSIGKTETRVFEAAERPILAPYPAVEAPDTTPLHDWLPDIPIAVVPPTPAAALAAAAQAIEAAQEAESAGGTVSGAAQ